MSDTVVVDVMATIDNNQNVKEKRKRTN